jgi:hypothetical protein
MRIASFLTLGFAAFVMATPVADPAAEASVGEIAHEARSVVIAESKIMASDSSPVDLVTRQGMCLSSIPLQSRFTCTNFSNSKEEGKEGQKGKEGSQEGRKGKESKEGKEGQKAIDDFRRISLFPSLLFFCNISAFPIGRDTNRSFLNQHFLEMKSL